MERTSLTYKTYLEILNRELVCAMGCTEPIAIAYCAAAARRALGALPTCIEVAASGNIIKNVKSVIVPNTGGLRGIAAAAAIGALAGDADAGLQVVSHVTPEQIAALPGYMAQTKFEISAAESEYLLDIEVTVRANDHFAPCARCRSIRISSLWRRTRGSCLQRTPSRRLLRRNRRRIIRF